MKLVVMGVAGSGKTALGQELSARLGWPFLDADDFHTPEARARMSAGEGLTDAERAPWLARLRSELEARPRVVLACSALRRSYREALRGHEVRFVFLDVPEVLLRARLEQRTGHYAGLSLLPSQLAALEAPEPDEEDVLVLEVTAQSSPEGLARRVLEHLELARA